MTLPDVRALLAALAQDGVDHVVIGGIALVRTLQALGASMPLSPARRFGAREAWMLRRGSNVSVSTRFGDLDIVRRLPGVPAYPVLVERAERYDIDGLVVSVASPTQLVAMKRARGSAQDQADLEMLRLLDEQRRQ